MLKASKWNAPSNELGMPLEEVKSLALVTCASGRMMAWCFLIQYSINLVFSACLTGSWVKNALEFQETIATLLLYGMHCYIYLPIVGCRVLRAIWNASVSNKNEILATDCKY